MPTDHRGRPIGDPRSSHGGTPSRPMSINTQNHNSALAYSDNSHMEEAYQGKDPAEIVDDHGYSSDKYED